MILKEDCADFGYSKNDITELEKKRSMNIPNYRIHKMSRVEKLEKAVIELKSKLS